LSPRALLTDLFETAVAAAQPSRCVVPHLQPYMGQAGRPVVIGAGKASAAMAEAVEAHWPGPVGGLVITRHGYARPCRSIEIVEADHPVPGKDGEAATRRIFELVRSLGPDDLVICLLSGGGSTLLSLPADGISLAAKQELTAQLLASGAPISDINTVRKHISAVKGGRLAAACRPAQLLTLAISDVAGDDLSVIASGPTVPDASTCADARSVIARYGIAAPVEIVAALESGANETPKPGDTAFADDQAVIIADAGRALAAASERARELGIEPVILGAGLEDEARRMGADMAARLDQYSGAPTVLLSGGEATVTVTGGGKGGPNTEFLLSLALALNGRAGTFAMACDTDGIDGSEDNAGAFLAPDTMERARGLGLDGAARLADNDAHGFFSSLGDLVVTGPTYTNVNDFRAILLT
jgi:glycerate 2-kinase